MNEGKRLKKVSVIIVMITPIPGPQKSEEKSEKKKDEGNMLVRARSGCLMFEYQGFG
jgi:hypothetical protein